MHLLHVVMLFQHTKITQQSNTPLLLLSWWSQGWILVLPPPPRSRLWYPALPELIHQRLVLQATAFAGSVRYWRLASQAAALQPAQGPGAGAVDPAALQTWVGPEPGNLHVEHDALQTQMVWAGSGAVWAGSGAVEPSPLFPLQELGPGAVKPAALLPVQGHEPEGVLLSLAGIVVGVDEVADLRSIC